MASNGDPGRTTSQGPRKKETLPKATAIEARVVTVASEAHKAEGATEVTTHKRATGRKTRRKAGKIVQLRESGHDITN